MPKNFVINFEDKKPTPCAFIGRVTENLPEDVETLGAYATLDLDVSLLKQYVKEKYGVEDVTVQTVAESDSGFVSISFNPDGGIN